MKEKAKEAILFYRLQEGPFLSLLFLEKKMDWVEGK